MSSTPPTSPQRHQAAARQAEHDNRVMGSPDRHRTPSAPSASTIPPPGLSSARAPTIFGGQTYHNLPSHLAAMAAALNAAPVVPQRCGRLPAIPIVSPAPVSLFYYLFII
jgi:hypothetical protein